MINITNELNKIRSETRGENVRDAIVSALKKISDNKITLKDKQIQKNGTYTPKDDSADGFSEIEVNVQPKLTQKNITKNGTYNSADDSADGYSSVSVNVQSKLGKKTIQSNGTYSASDDSLDGYSEITANVKPNVTTKKVTKNGTYNASDDGYDGYSSIDVDVASGTVKLGEKSISKSGTYVADDEGLQGYSKVTVSVDEPFAQSMNMAESGNDVAFDCGTLEIIPQDFNKYFQRHMLSIVGNYVKTIKNNSLSNENKMVHANFPVLNTIGDYAFDGNNVLEDVNIGNVSKINYCAFRHCNKLNKIQTTGKNLDIQSYAFQNCSSLNAENFDFSKVSVINSYAFLNCSGLTTSPIFSDGIKIDSNAFQGCKFTEAVFNGNASFSGKPFDAIVKDISARNVLKADGDNFISICNFDMTVHFKDGDYYFGPQGDALVPNGVAPYTLISGEKFYFDGVFGTGSYKEYKPDTSKTTIAEIDFNGKKAEVHQLLIYGRQSWLKRMPKVVTIYGSDDGSQWNIVGTANNNNNPPDINTPIIVDIPNDSNVAYEYIKIEFEGTTDNVFHVVNITELQLQGKLLEA